MVKVGQTLDMGGHYGPLGELGMIHFTQIHQYGHKWWGAAGSPQGPHGPPTAR